MIKLLIKHQLYDYAINTFFDRAIYNFAPCAMQFSDIQLGTKVSETDGSLYITITHNGETYVTYFTVDLFMDIAVINGKANADKIYRDAIAYEFYRFIGIRVTQ